MRIRTTVALLLLLGWALPSSAAAPLPRATADRPGTTGLRVHLVYLLAKGQPDRHRDVDGSLGQAAHQLQRWLARETDGRQLRVDTWRRAGRAVPDITFVRSPRTSFEVCQLDGDADLPVMVRQQVDCFAGVASPSSDPVAKVRADLERVGLNAPGVRYLVLVEGTAGIICGQGEGPEDGDRDPSHVGTVSAVFLGDPACPHDSPGSGGQVDWALAHELLHGDGAVPLGAPHQCAGTSGHVCTAGLANGSPYTDALDPERADIMYPSPGISLTAARLDPGHDDYYDTAFGLRDVADSPYLTPKR